MASKEQRCEFITALLAHDISNYNQTTRGYVEMLLDEQMGPLTEDQARVLTICLRQSNRIQSLIAAARMVTELQDQPPELKAVPLDDAIADAIRHTQATYADREVRVRFQPEQRIVLAEEPHLAVVFRNLLSNGVRHNDAEVVEIEVAVARAADDDPETGPWRVLVRDNGEGIPASRHPHLFDRLETLSIHGSGLGLSLVRFLVERWHGKVWIEPEAEGRGAELGLLLPAASI
jgi:signal transduction histidine kinase